MTGRSRHNEPDWARNLPHPTTKDQPAEGGQDDETEPAAVPHPAANNQPAEGGRGEGEQTSDETG